MSKRPRVRIYENRSAYAIPSLHIIGRADRIVAPPISLALAAHFENPTIVEHAGAHVIASDPHIASSVRAFLS